MKFRVLGILAVMTLLLAAVFVSPARSAPLAQTVTSGGPVSNSVASIAEQSATYAYWTADRMAAAQPMPLLEGPSGGFHPADAASLAPQGTADLASGFAPGQSSRPTSAQDLAAIQPATFFAPSYTYPYPYNTSYLVGAWAQFYPMRTNAKMFFTQNGGNYVCSATVVTDNGAGVNRLVATAGHCVHDGSNQAGVHWSSNILICPAYSNGEGPWGCWAWSQEWTTPQWYGSGDLRYDHGFVVTSLTSDKSYGRIASTIGTQGEAWNWGYIFNWWAFGYPAASPYNGAYLVWTTSETGVVDDLGLGCPCTMGIGSDQTGGSSGGAWIWGGRIAQPGYVDSHNDYKYTSPSMPLAMFGPYQGNDWLSLYNSARVSNP